MKLVEKYLMRRIGLGLLVATVILLPLFSFLDLVDQFDDIGQANYRMQDAFYFVLLLLPRRLIQLLPFIALLGNVIALGRLAANSEIISMRAAGLSPAGVSLASFKVGLCLLVLLAVLEQFAAPFLQQRAITHRSEALDQGAELGAKLGIWTRDDRQILRLGEAIRDTYAQDIEIFTLDRQGRLSAYLHAASADIISDGYWILHDVTSKDIQGARIHTTRLATTGWRPFLDAAQVATLTRPAESLPPIDLYHYANYLKRTGQQYDQALLLFWRKFGTGLVLLAMMLLSVPFVFGSVRAGVGGRLVLASITGVCVYLLDQILSNLGLMLGFNQPLVALAPGLMLLLIGQLWLQRVN